MTNESPKTIRIISRTPYVLKTQTRTIARCKKYGISCWIEKREEEMTEEQKNMSQFIDINFSIHSYYGITYKGNDYICGELPRDLSGIVRGIEIAEESLK